MKRNIILLKSKYSDNIYYKKKKKNIKKIKINKFDSIIKKHCIHVEK
ncbi:50S ribosomal subunit protein L33 [Candidatus Nasuia deltocephalinicola str. NAS-ALF]|uniref:Large ribosomal subunit protein bL33 n=1 Tax=Candidatus Nasuia deltocephalinicola str. NAS-ALF TaxID=1343077 RepID=S5TE93_9PROT|nr:50S ribosomal subunit protein L33 [Candidatus Nasuia deltocephalinicola str. NAS-ALF]